MHCDHTAHVNGFKFMVGKSNVWGTLTPKHVHLLPAVFLQFHLEQRCGIGVQTRRDISRMVEDRELVTIEY